MLTRLSKPFAAFKDVPLTSTPSRQDQYPQRLRAHHPGRLRICPQARSQESDRHPQSQRGARHRGHVPGYRQGNPQGLSRDRDGRCQRGRHLHVAAEESQELRCDGRHQHVWRHHLRPGGPDGGRPGLWLLGQHRPESWLSSNPAMVQRPSMPASTRSIRSPPSSRPR